MSAGALVMDFKFSCLLGTYHFTTFVASKIFTLLKFLLPQIKLKSNDTKKKIICVALCPGKNLSNIKREAGMLYRIIVHPIYVFLQVDNKLL